MRWRMSASMTIVLSGVGECKGRVGYSLEILFVQEAVWEFLWRWIGS